MAMSALAVKKQGNRIVPDTEILQKEQAQVDDELVEESVHFIRQTLTQTLYKGIRIVGEYLLDKYFEGDPERVRSHNPYKSASFRKLAERCGSAELSISKTWLYNAVSLAVMERLMPRNAKAYRQLTPSHQIVLLPLQDPERVEQYAQQAVKENLSVREFKSMIHENTSKDKNDPRGRKPKPIILKALDQSFKLFSKEKEKPFFSKEDFESLSDDDAERALNLAKQLLSNLQKLVKQLET